MIEHFERGWTKLVGLKNWAFEYKAKHLDQKIIHNDSKMDNNDEKINEVGQQS